MSPALRSENGSALVTAILVTLLFMTLGLSTLATVDTQQRESGRERVRESSFSLAEGALNSQIYLLSRQWPRIEEQAYATTCTQSTSSEIKCPDQESLQKAFNGVDYASGAQWSTEVHDNATGSADFYDDAVVRSLPGWDANGDSYVWVRAQAVLDPTGRVEHPRTLAALVRVEDLTAQFPRNAVVAGKLQVHPNGNQTYLATNGSYVILRCTSTTLNNANCRGWSRTTQVGPNAEIKVNATQPPAMTPEVLQRMRDTARANGTYYPQGGVNCPTSLAGALVFIEDASRCAPFNPSGRTAYNSLTDPGALVIGSGALTLRGNAIYYGVIYNANGSDGVGTQSSGTALTIEGGACVVGSAVIDGPGGLVIGSSNGASVCNGNLQFDPNVADELKAYGTAGIVQNSFREIKATD